MTPLDGPNSLIVHLLRERCSSAPDEFIETVARAWSLELDGIIQTVLETSAVADGSTLHYTLRDEITLELARLSHWLARAIVEKKLEHVRCHELDPAMEWERSSTQDARARIKATAQVVGEQIWSPMAQRWLRRSRRLLELDPEARQRAPRQLRTSQFVVENHFVPAFTNRPWANGKSQVIVVRRRMDRGLSFSRAGYGEWGKASYLYSQALERQLSAIESDARRPFQKLLQEHAFSGLDEQDWATFVIAQYLRTPRMILRHMATVRQAIEENGWDYPPTISNLRLCYELLFRDCRVYSAYFRAIHSRPWWVVQAHVPGSFFKPDEAVVLAGHIDSAGSSFLMPLSPEHCFVAGTLFREEPWPGRVGFIKLTAAETKAVQVQLARNARESVICQPPDVAPGQQLILEEHLAMHPWNFDLSLSNMQPYWGRLQP